ncbi:MAG TPA: pyruvate kinase, partial [Verrucomicrobiae bacterium]|nr:pyruvate kinase [Verrucomicrobiae bacterium]
MKQTSTVPNVPLRNLKRTKIIATVGPATDSYEAILGLIKAGANGIRLNFSHGTHEERTRQIKWVRKAARAYGKPVAIIQDLQGPKLRLGDFDGIVNVSKGQEVSLQYQADYAVSGHLPTQYELSDKVKRGERMYLYDGKIRMTITSTRNGVIRAKAENNGILIKRKGINLPDTDLGGDIITAKDRADLVYGSSQDIDYIALSFVQTADDIKKLRSLLKNMNSTAKIIAKVETKAAVDNIDDIVRTSDAVMVARGDLAIETPAESVPIVQRQIIGLGLRYAKPTIVATQLLGSMTDDPEPTRSEVSDVATAVLVGTDCAMLSDETANGSYPLEAVETMKRVILYTESHTPLRVSFPDNEDHSRQMAISTAILNLAESIAAAAIVAETKSGATALQ